MKAEDLNEKKLYLLLTFLTVSALFGISMKIGNGFVLSLVSSLLCAIPLMWILGLILSGIYEILVKPILKWLSR